MAFLLNFISLCQGAVAEHGAEAAEHVAEHAEQAAEGFNAGETIIGHVANGAHPLIQIPPVCGIDFSVTKHVLMLWIVAFIVGVVVIGTIQRNLRKNRGIPSGFMNLLEFVVLWVRDDIVEPNVGKKWVKVWAPLLLTFFFFIFASNLIGLVPLFDVIGLLDHYVLHSGPDSFIARAIHGGTTTTANFNVTAALATITFFAIILAGVKAHGFFKHWKNMVPHGLNPLVYIILIPIEVMGLFVRPFALTMRLAANMTGGHIAILALLSFVFLFTEMFHQALVGIGVQLLVSIPLAVAISGLEIIVVIVQAYVFTLLTAVFIGMAIHVHH
ncbi:MAG TPA: F0F1 ATP synthase subunit A [Terriglobia bacterium]|nr:F0F1 ATP synthase subunit A [Terriglobia bacterium]